MLNISQTVEKLEADDSASTEKETWGVVDDDVEISTECNELGAEFFFELLDKAEAAASSEEVKMRFCERCRFFLLPEAN